jgi:hypothetical protein
MFLHEWHGKREHSLFSGDAPSSPEQKNHRTLHTYFLCVNVKLSTPRKRFRYIYHMRCLALCVTPRIHEGLPLNFQEIMLDDLRTCKFLLMKLNVLLMWRLVILELFDLFPNCRF